MSLFLAYAKDRFSYDKAHILTTHFPAAAATVFEMDLDCLGAGPTSEVQQMIDANAQMFQLTAHLKFRLPLHKWFKTKTWKQLVEAEETIVR